MSESIKKIFIRNSAQNIGVKLFSILTNAVLSVFIYRALRPEGLGAFSVAREYGALFNTIFFLSIPTAFLYESSVSRKENFPLGIYIGNGLLASIILGALGGFFAVCVNIFMPSLLSGVNGTLLIIAAVNIPLSMCQQNLLSLVQGLNMLDAYNFFMLSETILLSVFRICSLWKGVYTPEVGLILFPATAAAVILLLARYLLKKSRHAGVDFKVFLETVRRAVRIHFGVIAIYLFSKIDIFIINYLLGQKDTGLYSMGVNIAGLFIMVQMSVHGMLFPLIARQGREASCRTAALVARFLFSIQAVCGLLAIYAAPVIVRFFGGEEYMPAVQIVRILLPGTILMSAPRIMTTLMMKDDRMGVLSLIAVISCCINAFLCVVMSIKWGIAGAASASSLSYAAAGILIILFLYRGYKNEINIFDYFLLKKADMAMLAKLKNQMYERWRNAR